MNLSISKSSKIEECDIFMNIMKFVVRNRIHSSILLILKEFSVCILKQYTPHSSARNPLCTADYSELDPLPQQYTLALHLCWLLHQGCARARRPGIRMCLPDGCGGRPPENLSANQKHIIRYKRINV